MGQDLMGDVNGLSIHGVSLLQQLDWTSMCYLQPRCQAIIMLILLFIGQYRHNPNRT